MSPTQISRRTAPMGSPLLDAADANGMEPVAEAFADRAYLADGRLMPRSEPGSVVTVPELVAARAVMIATERRVESIDGKMIDVEARSTCVHGDTPGAVAIAQAVRAGLEAASIGVHPFVG